MPLLPGDGACSSASHTKPAGLPITYCRDPKITGTVSRASWGLGDAQLLSSGKLNLGLFLEKIINTVVRRADLHLGLCLQTCPVPTGPALAPATTGSCFWLRQGVLSATLSLTVGFTGKDPPVDTSVMLGDTQQVWVGGTCKTTQPQIPGLRKDTSAPDAEHLLLSMRCSGCSATLPLWQFAGMPIPCLVLGFFPLSGRSCLWGWRGTDVPPVLPDASHPYSIPILSH